MPILKKELVKLKPVKRKIVKKGDYKNPDSKKGKPIAFRLPLDLDTLLREGQKKTKFTMNEYIELMVRFYFDEQSLKKV